MDFIEQSEIEIIAAAYEQLRKLPPHAVGPAIVWIRSRLRAEDQRQEADKLLAAVRAQKVEPMKIDNDI